MPASLTTFKATVERLIRRFESDHNHYLSKGYSEAQARVDFITPLFKALGWDVENEAALPHHSRDVLVEATEDTGGRPDYSFRVAGQTRFFVEAKAPSEELDTARHIIQAKTYAWNTKQVFFVVLTDFIELRFYDASIKPDERKPDEGLLLKFGYKDYVSKADKLWEFSRERVAAGSLEALLPRDRRTERLRIPVDEVFLDEMTGWREELARDIYKNNRQLTARQLNEVVQRLLDRIVFIRIAEDRRIIERYQLRAAAEEWRARGGKFDIFDWLRPLFERINEDFNGEIFKPDELLEKTKVDSEILARIIERLYPPKSPYRFDVIGVELLGSIYERYLGKTIRVTLKQVHVEEKPEVRKAGGVYYTPKYIVDYIVKNTVGKVIEGKTPKQIEKIRILDPACGSGSFLIGAFQYLIDYHVRYLTDHPKEAHVHPLYPDVIKDENGDPRLSVVRKASILKKNLYGVDIDPQAVEITMMSLYLKALEGERSQLPPKQHLLPELKYNIICGNSLIGADFYKDKQLSFIEDDEKFRVNVFDWQSGFPDIIQQGGFDCVIGNPPYVRQESLSEFKEYFERRYDSFHGVADLFVYFMERGIRLVKPAGYYSIIVSSSFLRTTSAEPLRRFLKKSAAVLRIIDFGGLAVFENAKDTYVCVPLLSKQTQPKRVEIARVPSLEFEDLDRYITPMIYTIPAERLSPEAWPLKSDAETRIFDKLLKAGQPLGEYVDRRFFRGVTTGLNSAFFIDTKTRRALIAADKRSADLIKPLLTGEDIRQWVFHRPGMWLIFPRRGTDIDSYPAIKDHLSQWKSELSPKKSSTSPIGRKPGKYKWFEIQDDVAYFEVFESPKIIFPDIAKGPRFCLDTGGHYLANTAYCLGTGDRYLLGILNSKLCWFAISNISIPFGVRAGEYRYRLIYQYMEKVPIRPVDLGDPSEKARHDRMVALVDQVLRVTHKAQSDRLAPSEARRLQGEATSTSAQIDELVYDLYGITKEERRIIEGSES